MRFAFDLSLGVNNLRPMIKQLYLCQCTRAAYDLAYLICSE